MYSMDTEGSVSVAMGSVGRFVGAGLGTIPIIDGIRTAPEVTAKLCNQAYGLAQTWVSEAGNGVAHNWPRAWELMRRCAIDNRSVPAQIDLAWGMLFAVAAVAEPWVSGEPDRPLNNLDHAINGFQGACAVGSVHLARVLAAGVEVALDPVMWANMDKLGHILGLVAVADMLVLGVWPTIKLMTFGILRSSEAAGREVEEAAVAKREVRRGLAAKRRALKELQAASRAALEEFPAQLEQVVTDNEAERARIRARGNYMGSVFPGDEGQARMAKVITILGARWARARRRLFQG